MATTMSRSGVERYVAQAKEALAKRAAHRARVRRLKFDTIAVHGMYSVEEAFSGGQGGIIEPIFPSTSQAYRDSDEMEAALSYQIPTWCYSRIHNPGVFYLEETLALLESYGCEADATGLCTSSGMAAIKQATEPLLAKGEQIIAAPTLVKKLPLPLRRVIGDLSNTDRVLLGLDLRPA